MKLKTLPIFLAFFIMGFGDAVGTLVAFAVREFNISKAAAGLLPFFGFVAYALFSVPAGVLADKKGKKFVLVLGLLIVLAGELLPVLSMDKYVYLVFAIFLIGSGMTILQVAGNPLMRDVSDPGKYSRNLTFAQFIKSIGSNTAPYMVPLAVILGFSWTRIFPIYAAVVFLALLAVLALKVTETWEGEERGPVSLGGSFALLKEPYVLLMVLGIFLYVGAEVGLNSWIATYLKEYFHLDINMLATLGIGFFLTALAVGRLLGSVILSFMSPKKFFVVSSLLGVLSILGLYVSVRQFAIACVFLAGLSFANIFPLIFSILIDSKPEKSGELSGLLCMAIFGGAVIPYFMGVVADHFSIVASFTLPLLSFVFIAFLAFKSLRAERVAPGLAK
jgi:FHS family L-fucose permease-like MFS transporter